MNTTNLSTRDRGAYGENVAAEYLRRHGFEICGRNIARKTGEIDIIAKKEDILHFVEVKSLRCTDFPTAKNKDIYKPSDNLHPNKLRKVARTAEWLVAEEGWEGEWQIDAVLVWIRDGDNHSLVRFVPCIL